jgi:Rrf2 family protein
MSEGVEWVLHSLLTLGWLDDGEPVPAARLAAESDLPPAYLNKQLQALVRAGLLVSTPGAKGGFRLARPLSKITLMDVVAAIEGPQEAFRCTEIRRRGSGAGVAQEYLQPCAISTAMRRAELAWRRELAAQSLADVQAAAAKHVPMLARRVRRFHGRD